MRKQKEEKQKRARSSRLWLYLTMIVFIVVVCTLIIVAGVCLVVFEYDAFSIGLSSLDSTEAIIIFLGGSLIIGSSITAFLGRFMIRHLQKISNAFEELASGNFEIRVPTNQRLDEIRNLSSRFNDMAYRLSKTETLGKDFIMNVSHEFKTPLSSISGYATLLQNPSLSREKHDRYVDIILQNASLLSELSSNILSLSKLENQNEIDMGETFRLDEQIREQVLLLEDKWAKKCLSFELEIPKIVYKGNEGLLGRVWSNIIDNAIKHSYENGIIEIFFADNEKSISVTIRDHGEGMSEEICENIFNKFYQGDGSRRSEGSGLGLPLAKKIVELFGGSISAISDVGKGASFTVTLPKK